MPTGTYFDGNVARPQPVAFEFTTEDTLRIAGETVAQELPLASVRVSDRLGDVPRFLYLAGGAIVETCDNAAVDAAWHIRRRGRGAQLIHFLESQRAIAAMACVALLLGFASLGYFGPPWLARIVAHRVPEELDRRLGAVALASISPYFSASSLSAADRERVRVQLRRLRPDAPEGALPAIQFWSMSGGLPNAFALPGNVIVITDELMWLPANDDEIAAVLAHELGHLEHRHGLQGLLRDSFALLVVTAATGDLSTLTSFAAAVPLSILTKGYSRDLEREADHYALELLRAREIKPQAFVTILTKLDEARSALQRNSTYLSTHPATEERTALFGGITPGERNAALAESWLAEGKQAAERQDHLQALGYFDRAIEHGPTAGAYLLRAKSRFMRNEQAGADADLAKVLELNPQSVEAHELQLEMATAKSDYDAMIEAAGKVRALEPAHPLAAALLGYALSMKGDATAALAHFDEAIALAPADHRAWAYRGLLKDQRQDHEGALADYTEALRRRSDLQWVLANRGMLHVRRRNYDEGLADLLEVTDERQQNANYFFHRGVAYQGMRRRTLAIANYTQAFDKKPSPQLVPGLHVNRGQAHLEEGDFRAALSDLDAAIAAAPDRGEIYVHRATIRRRADDPAGALADLERAREKGATEIAIKRVRYNVHFDLGNHADAIRDLDALIAAEPAAWAYRMRGLNEFCRANWTQAERDLSMTVKLTGLQPEQYAHFFLLLVRRRQGVDDRQNDFAATIADWRSGWAKTIGRYLIGQVSETELLEETESGKEPTRDERLCEAYFYIGETRLIAGETDKAAEFFEKCIAMNVTSFVEHTLAQAELKRLRAEN